MGINHWIKFRYLLFLISLKWFYFHLIITIYISYTYTEYLMELWSEWILISKSLFVFNPYSLINTCILYGFYIEKYIHIIES